MDHAFGTPLWHKASLADWPVYILWLWGHSPQDRQEGEHAAVNKSELICLVNMFKRIESLDWIKIPTQRMNIILFLVWINFCIIIASMHDFVFRIFWIIIQNCLTFTFLHTHFYQTSTSQGTLIGSELFPDYPQGLRVARSVILMWVAFCSIWHPTAVDMSTIRYSIIFQQPAARWKSVSY